MRRILTILLILFAATAAHADLSHFTGKIESADGVEIAYETWGAGLKAVVFVHGWSCDRTYWQDQIAHFSRTYKVVTIDLAGHGESGLEREEYTMEAFGADVVAVLQVQGITDAVLVGHSMGGPVIVEAFLQAADRVRGLVGIDNFQVMTGGFPPEEVVAFTAALEADFAGTVEPWVHGMFLAGADSVLVDTIAKDMAAAPPKVGVNAIRHAGPWMDGGGVPSLQRLAVNLVCVSGAAYTTDVEANRKIVPGFRVWILEGTGHFLMREQPAEFNALLDEALATFGYGAPQAPANLRVE